jgi:hypothetical protein
MSSVCDLGCFTWSLWEGSEHGWKLSRGLDYICYSQLGIFSDAFAFVSGRHIDDVVPRLGSLSSDVLIEVRQ